MNLFLDASVVLAACGRPAGASRAVFDLALRNGWALMTSPYMLSEVTRNLPRLLAQAAQDRFSGAGACRQEAEVMPGCDGKLS